MKKYLKANKNRVCPGKILVTAGPTIEPLDPVRFFSNFSTGTIGYAIAGEAVKRGFEVCLISGPVSLSPPLGTRTIFVTTAREMRAAVMDRIKKYDCIIMSGAVCDFRPKRKKTQKIKKKEKLTVELVRNPDILRLIKNEKGLIKIGFALETNNPIKNGKDKLRDKNLDLIIINEKNLKSNPFGKGQKNYILIDSGGNIRKVLNVEKNKMAEIILEETEKLMSA